MRCHCILAADVTADKSKTFKRIPCFQLPFAFVTREGNSLFWDLFPEYVIVGLNCGRAKQVIGDDIHVAVLKAFRTKGPRGLS